MHQRSPRLGQQNFSAEPEPETGRRVTVRLPDEDYAVLEAEVLRRSIEAGKLLNFSIIWRECVRFYIDELKRRAELRDKGSGES